MKIEANSTMVMIGDSITDCGRQRPHGMPHGGLGNGYVNMVSSLITARYPERGIRVINTGIGGNTVRDLKGRWRADVLDLQPNWVSIKIGINDVWRNFANYLDRRGHVPLEEYRATLEELVATTRPGLHGMVLVTPYFIETNRADPMRAMMDSYSEVVRALAVRYDAVLVDAQAAFDAALEHLHPMAIAGDRVHPNPVGHAILARAFLRAIAYDCQGGLSMRSRA